jgi:hypothetical protein
MPVEMFSIGFCISTSLYTHRTSERPAHSEAALCTIATTATIARYGTHLLAVLRPAPAVVHRYAG